MIEVKCPKCDSLNKIDIAKAVDSEGEVFECHNCKYHFRYTLK